MDAYFSDKEDYIIINGIKHWYKIEGAEHKTIPIIIIHGGPGGNQYLFEQTLGPKLAQEFTVIYYEQRGSGRSEKPLDKYNYSIPILVDDLEKLRRTLKIKKMYILGSSFGSWIAMEYTLAYQRRVEKLILQGPVDGDWERLSINQFFGLQFVASDSVKLKIEELMKQKGPIEERKEKLWSVIDQETIARLSLYNHSLIPEAMVMMREANKYGFNEDFHQAITKGMKQYPLLLDRIKDICIPTKIIVGLHDRNTGVEMSRDISVRIPNSTLVILYNSAHYPETEELETYTKEITGYLKE